MSFFAKTKSFVSTNKTTIALSATVVGVAVAVVTKDKSQSGQLGAGISAAAGGILGAGVAMVNNKFSDTKLNVAQCGLGGALGCVGTYYGAKHFGLIGSVASSVAEEVIVVVADEVV